MKATLHLRQGHPINCLMMVIGAARGWPMMALIVLSAVLAQTRPVLAGQVISNFSIQYFEMNVSAPDFYKSGGPLGVSYNYVTSTLGPDGLPVFNPFYTAASGSVSAPSSSSLIASTNEINWWSPANNANLKSDGSGTIGLSSTPTTMYAPGTGGNDSTYFETSILTGSFYLSSATLVQFSVGADDAAFVYVDGNLVLSLGGIHSDTAVPSNNAFISSGAHQIEIFYADLEETQAFLSFSALTPSVFVPEPSTFAIFGAGLIGLGLLSRRKCHGVNFANILTVNATRAR